MNCAKCQAQLADGSGFCNKCGAPQGAPAPAAPPPPPAPPAAPVSSDDQEDMIWQGRYSGWTDAPKWILWLLYACGLAYVFFALVPAEKRQLPAVMYVTLGILALPAIYIAGGTLVRKLTVRYKLTSHRFFRERGFISRRMDELELMRVDDVSVSQNILQRIFNIGVVTIISADPTDPRLLVEGIENPIEVKEKIRTHVHKRRKGVVKMDHI